MAAKSTPKMGSKVTLKPTAPGQSNITFKKGGLHQSLGVPMGKKIPAPLIKAAMAGKHGPKAQKQALLMHNVLTGRK